MDDIDHRQEKPKQQSSTPQDSVRRSSLARDTSIEAERVQIEMFRRMPPEVKALRVREISLGVQKLALAGIRQRHPRASDRELFLRFAILKLGRTLAVRAFPDAAEISER